MSHVRPSYGSIQCDGDE